MKKQLHDIKIAIIDSGVSASSRFLKNVEAGIAIGFERDRIKYSDDITDQNGHGTTIFEIINMNIENAGYYIIKIFEKELKAPVENLVDGIRWAIAQNMDIINISLGTISNKKLDELKKICMRAHYERIKIVSCLSNKNEIAYPGWFTQVYCVCKRNVMEKRKIKKNLIIIKDKTLQKEPNSYLVARTTARMAQYIMRIL